MREGRLASARGVASSDVRATLPQGNARSYRWRVEDESRRHDGGDACNSPLVHHSLAPPRRSSPRFGEANGSQSPGEQAIAWSISPVLNHAVAEWANGER